MQQWRTVTLACCLMVVVLVAPVVAQQDRVPTDELRKRFFRTLNNSQIVEFTTALDKSKQLTAYELGAKYRWGYIPPDRTPPASLAQWWRSLSPRQRNEQRLKWFKNHNQQLNPDRVARQLGLQDRLTKIFRELRADYSKTPEVLESVPFPDSQVSPTRANQGSTEFQKIYKQQINPRQSTDEVDQRPEYLPGDPGDPNRSVNEPKADTTEDQTESKPDTRPGDSSETVEEDTVTTDRAESTSEKSEPEEFASGDLMYRRVGDHIEVVGRTEGSTEETRTPRAIPEVGTTDRSDTPSMPAVTQPDRTQPDTVAIPPPTLRFLNERDRSDALPELRRSR